tara:strand:- start:369 stop:3041 length:2673 start_codon:yes stop_codon:yes gene_type:complete
MALQTGTKLGIYEVTGKLGEGGMGEVYRAHDTTLERDVALKVLSDAFVADPDRLARFEREAKVLASLNHPNIGVIHGLESSSDTTALVLELIEGPTLADRIADGPMATEEAVSIATQIAEALDAAHEQGIVHRDLKPANVKVRPDGTVKVLDFGLAKAVTSDSSGGSDAATMSITGASQAGMVVGTAAYMAPEQARGKTVDKRADIWAFGVVLFEMVTGGRLFEGEDVTDTIAAVVREEPDWNRLPADLPARLVQVLRGCLRKAPAQRVRDIGDVRLAIEGLFETTVRAPVEQVTVPTTKPWLEPVPLGLGALGLLLLGGIAAWLVTPAQEAPEEAVVRFAVPLEDGSTFTRFGRHSAVITADGSQIIYVADSQLFIRRLNQLQANGIPGTQDDPMEPFVSPDGEWVGFFAGGQLKKVALSGGAPVSLCDATPPYGVSWGEDDMVLFGQGGEGIWQVPGTSGIPEQLISVEDGDLAHGPQMLPGGEWVLFTLASGASWNDADIVMQSIETGERITLVQGGRDARYVDTGHLVYGLNGVVFAIAFDLDGRQVLGGPVPLVEGVRESTFSGASQFAIARNGTLVYVPGTGISSEGGMAFSWVSLSGDDTAITAPNRAYSNPRLSPDGTRLVTHIVGEGNIDVWVWRNDDGPLTRLTFDDADDNYPLFTPDNSRIVFASGRDPAGLYWKASDGTGEVELLSENPEGPRPFAWSADGQLIFVQRPGDIAVMNIDGEPTIEPLFATEFIEDVPAISPDGKWIAYQSDESGQPEIYVQPFPDINNGKWQVSTNTGFDPMWSRDGSQLYYNAIPGVLMVSEVTTEPTFNPGTPSEAFPTTAYTMLGPGRNYDLAPDNERFLMRRLAEGTPSGGNSSFTGMIVIENWFNELTDRVTIP